MSEVNLDPGDQHLGPYRLLRRLGAGGGGEVFLAFDERLERVVAIKRVRHGASCPPAARQRFQREARAVARLNHPAIVQVHDLLQEGGTDAIVLEYVEGRTVASMVAEGGLPLASAVALARQVAEGLAAAHERGLIHRDLKAENVMVTSTGQAKILDFGLTRSQHGKDPTLTEEGMVVGTARAMSPEQAGGGEVDQRSDLFSFGVLLYEMLTGRSPFLGENTLRTMRNVIARAPRPAATLRPDLPPALADLLDRLLAKDPRRRPACARQVARTLQAQEAGLRRRDSRSPMFTASEEEPTGEIGYRPEVLAREAERRSPVSGSAAGRRRRAGGWRLALAVALALLLALAAVVILSVWRVGASPSPAPEHRVDSGRAPLAAREAGAWRP